VVGVIRAGWTAEELRRDADELAEDLNADMRAEARDAYDDGRDEDFGGDPL
jgi:hypothetical protein